MSLWGCGGCLDITQEVPFFLFVRFGKRKIQDDSFSNMFFNVSNFFSVERTDFL